MQRTPVASRRDLLVDLFGLPHRAVLGQRDHTLEQRTVPLQAVQIDTGQLECRHAPGSYQLGEICHGQVRDLVAGRRTPHPVVSAPA